MTDHSSPEGERPLSALLHEEPQSASEPAFTDTLTRFPNRRHAAVYLDRQFAQAGVENPLTVVFFQIDHLDELRDREGLEAADAAVRMLAHTLAETTRKSNLSARWSADTFLTVLNGSDLDGGLVFGERVRARIESSGRVPKELTVSAGVAAHHPGVHSAERLLANAEKALAEARSAGRNRVRVHGRQGAVRPDTDPPAPEFRLGSSDDRRNFGKGRKVLLVEDDESVRRVLDAFLVREGFTVHQTGDATSALWELRQEFDVLVTDIRLPGATGTELVSALKSRWPATQAIVITGMKDAQVAAEALNAGADRYLFKPFGTEEFRSHLVDALRARQRTLEDRRARNLLSHEARERAEQARQAVLRGARALVTAVEVRDPYTRGHSMRVSAYAQILAGEGRAGDDRDLEPLRLACELHDVGKIGIPDAILNKNGPLTEDEYDEVRRHPLTGRRILEPLVSDETVLSVVRWHHERWDGTGYPDGLEGDEIPGAARLVSLADALDAMTSTRAYREALPWNVAVDQIRTLSGSQFDPTQVEVFERALPVLRELFQDLER